MRELRLVEFVLRPLVVALADDPLVPRRLRAGKFAFGGTDRDAGHVRVLLALQDLAAHVDLLAAQVDDEALERGALALELVLQPGAVDGGEQVAFLDGVARVAVERDGAGRGRIQRGTDGGHDGGLRRDVAEELAARHGRDAHAIERDGRVRRRPALQEPREDRQRPSTSSATAAAMWTRRSCRQPLACSTTRSWPSVLRMPGAAILSGVRLRVAMDMSLAWMRETRFQFAGIVPSDHGSRKALF